MDRENLHGVVIVRTARNRAQLGATLDVNLIVASATIDIVSVDVRTRAGPDNVVAGTAGEHIVASPATHGVGGIGAREGVVAEAAIEHHLARPGDLAAGRKADVGPARTAGVDRQGFAIADHRRAEHANPGRSKRHREATALIERCTHSRSGRRSSILILCWIARFRTPANGNAGTLVFFASLLAHLLI